MEIDTGEWRNNFCSARWKMNESNNEQVRNTIAYREAYISSFELSTRILNVLKAARWNTKPTPQTYFTLVLLA